MYTLVIGGSLNEVRRLSALKVKYGFESLDARLAYELTAATSKPKPKTGGEVPAFSYAVLRNLKAQEEDASPWNWREHSLRNLHERTYQQFAFAAGFGVGRMPYLFVRDVELEPPPVIALPLALPRLTAPPVPSELETTHLSATLDFIAPERMGYIRNRNAVAGFGSHGFSDVERWTERENESPGESKWRVIRLELVSLLRHTEPMVYVSDALPIMDQLEEVPTRPLDTFEQHALDKLRFDQDAVADINEHCIKMLGAVRAGNYCLQCHEGQRGALLGAFSYELVPIDGIKLETDSPDGYSVSDAN